MFHGYGNIMSQSFEVPAREPLNTEHVERFKRIYGTGEVEVTTELDAQFRDTLALGNHARTLLDAGTIYEDPVELQRIVWESDETVGLVMGITISALADRVQAAWSSVPESENRKSSGLLNTLCEARTMFRQVLEEVDGTEDDGQTISGAIEETALRVEEWLKTPGSYVMRSRQIKAKILSQEEVESVYGTLENLEKGSEDWLRERRKLLESVHRLGRHIAVERFLKRGRLPSLVSVDDLANEATEYAARRIDIYDVTRGLKFSGWVVKYLDHYYARRLPELLDPIHIPQQHKDTLFTSDPAKQLGVARIINERPEGLRLTHQAWLALGRNILRLDGGDGPSDSDQFVTDPEGGEQNITWHELLSDHHRLVSGEDNDGNLWPGSGQADMLETPATFTQDRDMSMMLRKIMDELIINERDRTILRLRFGLDGGEPLTQEEIGKRVGVSGPRIGRLESRIISRFRRALVWDKESPYYGEFDGYQEGVGDNLAQHAPHKGQPDFPEYVVAEAASAEVLEELSVARRARSGAVDPSEWDW